MRQTLLVITVLLVASLATGCTSTEAMAVTPPQPSKTAAARFDDVKTKTNDAAQAMRDYSYAQKAEFVSEMKIELAKIQIELDQLAAKVESTTGAAKDDAKLKLYVVRQKWDEAKKQLDQAQSATESNWTDFKNGFKQSYTDLKDSFDNTRQWLSDKIKP